MHSYTNISGMKPQHSVF